MSDNYAPYTPRRERLRQIVSMMRLGNSELSSTQIARRLGMKPSTHVNNMLWQLWHNSVLDCERVALSGGYVKHVWTYAIPFDVDIDEIICEVMSNE